MPGNRDSAALADLLALRLQGHLSTDDHDSELFRFYAPSRFKEQAPDELLYTFTQSGGHFSVPSMDLLKNFKVIVSTL